MQIESRFRSELNARVLKASLAGEKPHEMPRESTREMHLKLSIFNDYLPSSEFAPVLGTDRETNLLDAATRLPLLLGP
jgi:hypothetical protein